MYKEYVEALVSLASWAWIPTEKGKKCQILGNALQKFKGVKKAWKLF